MNEIPSNTVAADPDPERFRAPRRIFWVALGIRLLYMTVAHTYRFRTVQDHFGFAWEAGRIARALVTGFGFADPFAGHSGPTAWVPPLYPFLLAAIFKVFGIYTLKSAWVAVAINCVFSATIVPAIYEIAVRCYSSQGLARSRSVAWWSAWIWALHPAAMQYAVRWPWEMSITTCLFAWVLVLALRVRRIGEAGEKDGQTTRRWVVFGLLWGVIALSNPALLITLPVIGVWMLWGVIGDTARLGAAAGRSALAGMIFLACVTPWMWRNWTVFHAVIPVRGNFGAELYSALLEGNNGFSWGPTVPVYDSTPKYQEYRRLGEHVFVEREGAIANAYARTHRAWVLKLVVKRIYFFWMSIPHSIDRSWVPEAFRVTSYCFASLAGWMGLGLSLRRGVPGAWMFAVIFVIFPVTYYLVIAEARYRHPLEPLITIFAVFLFQSAVRGGRVATESL